MNTETDDMKMQLRKNRVGNVDEFRGPAVKKGPQKCINNS